MPPFRGKQNVKCFFLNWPSVRYSIFTVLSYCNSDGLHFSFLLKWSWLWVRCFDTRNRIKHLLRSSLPLPGYTILLSCQTQSVLQDLFFGRNVCVFIFLIYIYFLVFLLQFFQISTRSVDHSFSAIVLKLDMYTRELNSVRRTKFRRSKVKVTRRSNIKINETLSFWVNFIGSSPNLVDI